MVEYLTDRLMEKGLSVQVFNAVDLDSGALLMALVDASTVVFASPAVLAGPHPSMAYVATLVNALAPKTRYAAMIGSYGWGTTMPDVLMEMLREFRATFFEPVLAKGTPGEETFLALDELAEAIAQANFSNAKAGELALVSAPSLCSGGTRSGKPSFVSGRCSQGSGLAAASISLCCTIGHLLFTHLSGFSQRFAPPFLFYTI